MKENQEFLKSIFILCSQFILILWCIWILIDIPIFFDEYFLLYLIALFILILFSFSKFKVYERYTVVNGVMIKDD